MWQPYKFSLDHIIVMTMSTRENHTKLPWIISQSWPCPHTWSSYIQSYLGYHSHDHVHTCDHQHTKLPWIPFPGQCAIDRFKVNSCWESKEIQSNLSKALGRPEHSTTGFTRGQGFCLSDFCLLHQFIWLVRTVLKYPSLRVIRSTMSWVHPTIATNCWSCSMRSPVPHTHNSVRCSIR